MGAAHAALLVVLAAGIAALGRWGRASADQLVPAHLVDDDRERRTASLRRGGLACYVASAVVAGAAVLAVI